ncbi:MAG: 16S rRNA (adenine(1518)-N(6)/adenine(1519)-N(6))-dimethyltransferase RsmA, partial [Candidatus Portnoybacteria bacterium]
MTKTEIKEILNKHSIAPNRRMGQSFLIDKNILHKIIETANISKNDTILEIGAGLGNLTKKLAEEARKVITLEKSKQLFPLLKENLKEFNNIEIIQGDVLKDKLNLPDKYKIVANIPYYITSPIIRIFLESENSPEEMILLIQKEVGQRIIAQPPRMNLLALSVQFYARPKIAFHVSKNCFWPKPEVDSSLIKISDIKKPEGIDQNKFFEIVKAGFSSP